MKAIDYSAADERLRGDLEHYCHHLVKIKTKEGGIKPFEWNKAQRHLHKLIGKQKEDTGRVRVLVLKGRQMGISTYFGARFYHRTSLNLGISTYILTHEDTATQNLFAMAKRVHEHMPPDYRPRVTASNANELNFGLLESGYKVGTARNIKGAGRSNTMQCFHGSEVAFWERADGHVAGALQAVGNVNGTEIALESTANGIGGVFYDKCMLAERGKGEFQLAFLPWYWDAGYRRVPDPDWAPSGDELQYGRQHGLDDQQLCWLSYKNMELGGEPGKLCWLFRQEYPGDPQEAFQGGTDEALIPSEYVVAARRAQIDEDPLAPRVLGVDVARGGADFTRIIDRKGRTAGNVVNLQMDAADGNIVANKVAELLETNKDIERVFIDVTGGYGGSPYDLLMNMGYGNKLRGVNFGERAMDHDRYRNRRAEIWDRMKEWMRETGAVSIPDDDDLHRHICAPGFQYGDGIRLQLESKEKIKKRVGFSPDGGDALALTFAEYVAPKEEHNIDYSLMNRLAGTGQSWMTR